MLNLKSISVCFVCDLVTHHFKTPPNVKDIFLCKSHRESFKSKWEGWCVENQPLMSYDCYCYKSINVITVMLCCSSLPQHVRSIELSISRGRSRETESVEHESNQQGQ